MKRRTFSALAAVLAVTGGACGPPKTAPNVVMKELSTDIIYGTQHKPAPPAPVAGANPTPGFPAFIVPPPPAVALPGARPATPVPAPKPACPDDDPLTFPAEPAPNTVSGPPTPGTYVFRQQGTVKIGTAAPINLPQTTSRQVRNVATAANGDITYDVAISAFDETTTTSYAVRRSAGDPSLDGVFITHVVTRRGDASVDEFAPLSGARIIALPAGQGVTWNDVATDPIHGTSMIVQGQVNDHGRVNACGTVLDSWVAQVTVRLLGPAKDLTLQATYQVGTQYGGFVLADHVSLTGTEAGQQVEQTSSATISDPKPAPLAPQERRR